MATGSNVSYWITRTLTHTRMVVDAGGVYVDGQGPLPIVRPGSVPELAETIREAVEHGEAVYPLGGGTLLDYGLPPAKPGRAIDMRGLNRLVEYPAADMTVTVEAGQTLAQLQRVLHEQGQWLPLDVPLAEHATLGGALATNWPGPRRYGYGSWRDYVLGMTVVNDRGELTRSGGRVVKNVAGYDLHKLHIGALGTLGVLVEVTLKIRPLPESRSLLCWRCPENVLSGLLDAVHASQTRPVTIAVMNDRAARLCNTIPSGTESDSCLVLLGFEEKRSTVRWQREQIHRELSRISGSDLIEEWEEAESLAVWQALTDFPAVASAPVSFRVQVLPSQTVYVLRALKHLGEAAWLAHAGQGTIYGHWWNLDEADLKNRLTALRKTAAAHSRIQAESVAAPGRVVVLRCPPTWKTPALVWGDPPNDQWLQRKIKDTFDPRHCFNPGRFPAGW
ncbi:MAG: FAD-binding oxidoreductase [Gemmatales bacterium]|nr:FAD-binding oxidoreductase [Gemmatales bacterium]MDW8174704.1 FAD-binding oxidoreductase [Gemmatales bacterium]